MRIESLENRRLLSVTLSGTVLTITGTGAADNLQILSAPVVSNFIVQLNGTKFTFAKSKVAQINASLLAGADFGDLYYAPVGVKIDLGDGIDNVSGSLLNDTINGGAGADRLNGRNGNDVIDGGADNDNIAGGVGNNTLKGGTGNDIVNGDSGNDSVDGGVGTDLCYGSSGNDTVLGGDGNDVVDGSDGNDLLDGGLGPDTITGGRGTDTVTYASRSAAVFVDPEPLAIGTYDDGQAGEKDQVRNDIENVIGGAGNDKITAQTVGVIGSFLTNRFEGGKGNDTLTGLSDNDTLIGGDGDDSILGGDGNDSIDGGAGKDSLFGAAGNDIIQARDLFNDKVDGGLGTDSAKVNAGDIKTSIEILLP